jgi:putative oxygen-independent coproporphyrinogen III oxidase
MPPLVPPPLSLYIHFPWCVRKCPYCDFNSYTLHGELAEAEYVGALARDLEAQAPHVSRRTVVSVFMGGGTPSLFSPTAVARVLDIVRRHLTLAADAEITMEANPGTIERGRFADYRAAGLTRVSLGAQTFDAARLAVLGRIHSAEETRRAAEELHAAGLDNFNLDLMYALPEQDVNGALRDVEEALSLAPTHVSHYQLTLEAGTVFAGQPPSLPDDDVAAEMLSVCRDRLAASGFTQYEVSAYARAGRRCRHNLNYWTFGDYLGIGAGAHGKITGGAGHPASAERFEETPVSGTAAGAASHEISRTWQTREPRRYVADPVGALTWKPIPPEELPFEFMLNALRLVDGFEIDTFVERTGLEWIELASTVRSLKRRGLLDCDQSTCRPTPLGARFLNDLLLSFLAKRPKTIGDSGLSTVVSGPRNAPRTALYTGSKGADDK